MPWRTKANVVTGAEKLPMDLYDAFLQQFGIEVLQGYGLTEEQAMAYKRNPVDNLAPLAKAKIKETLMDTGALIKVRTGFWIRRLDVRALLGLQSNQDSGATHSGCLHLVFGEVPGKPDRRQALVVLSCAPADGPVDKLAVIVDGPGGTNITRTYTDVPIAPRQYYRDNDVTFGPGSIPVRSGEYRTCYLLYTTDDAVWPALKDCRYDTV